MLRLSKDRLVWWPAKVQVPVDEGKTEEITVDLRVRLQTKTGMKGVQGAVIPKEDEHAALEAIVDWRGGIITDADGQPLAFSKDALKLALEFPYIERAFVTAIVQASLGAAAKN